MDLLGLLPIVLIGAVFYLLIIRPSRNRQRQQREMVNQVGPGTEVMTTAGIFGTVVDTTDDEVFIEVAPGVVLRMLKAAIGRVIEPDIAPEAIEAIDADAEHAAAESPAADADAPERDDGPARS